RVDLAGPQRELRRPRAVDGGRRAPLDRHRRGPLTGTTRLTLPLCLGMGLELGLLRLELRLAVGVRLLRGVRSLARLLELARVDLRRGSRLCWSWPCGPRLAVSGLRGSWLRGSRLAIARLNRPALLPL